MDASKLPSAFDISTEMLLDVATALAESHGPGARQVVAETIKELETEGDHRVASVWRHVEALVNDLVANRIAPGSLTLH